MVGALDGVERAWVFPGYCLDGSCANTRLGLEGMASGREEVYTVPWLECTKQAADDQTARNVNAVTRIQNGTCVTAWPRRPTALSRRGLGINW